MKEKMKDKRRRIGMGLMFAVLFTLLAFVSVGCAADTYTVCPSGCDYTSIQAAVSAAQPGDIIEVHSGTYYENVDVDKQLTLRGVEGSGMPELNGGMLFDYQFNLLVNDPSGDESYSDIGRIWITKDEEGSPYGPLLIFDFEYHQAGDYRWWRIYLDTDNNPTTGYSVNGIGADYRINPLWYFIGIGPGEKWDSLYGWQSFPGWFLWGIVNCTDGPEGADIRYKFNFIDYDMGFTLTDATTIRMVFESMDARMTPAVGDDMAPNSGYVELNVQNWMTDYRDFDIALDVTADGCTIDGFRLTDSDIALAIYSNNTKILNNFVIDNFRGVSLDTVDNVTISDNRIESNWDEGLIIRNSENCVVRNNTLEGNIWGISIRYPSSNNLVYNNYFDNFYNVFDNGNNNWNIAQTPGTNIVGGSWLGGNYWSDYAGEDTNADGLGNTLLPYNSNGGIQNGGDWLPLVKAMGRWDINEDGITNYLDAAYIGIHYGEVTS